MDTGKKPEDTVTGTEGKVSETSAEIAKLKADLAKSEKEKEIYRSGLLSAKKLGKEAKKLTAEEVQNPEKVEELVETKIAEKELEKKAQSEMEAQAEEHARLKAENEELRRSLEAKRVSTGFTGGSAGSDKAESQPQGYWSDAQKTTLRQIYESRGFYKPEMIDKMIKEAERNAMQYSNKGTASTLQKGNTIVPTRQY